MISRLFDTIEPQQIAKNAKAVYDYCSTITDPTVHNLCAVGAGASAGDNFSIILVVLIIWLIVSIIGAAGPSDPT